MKNIQIHQLSVGNLDNFVYIIEDTDSELALVVDPAWDADKIEDFISEKDLTLAGVLLTHSHNDHTNALANLEKTNPKLPVYLSKAEHDLNKVQPKHIIYVEDQQTIKLGNSKIECLFTPGHTLGGVCYLVDGNLITGDTLFVYGCGRCDFAESDVNMMFSSLQKIKNLPDDTLIYAGHNYGCKPVSNILEQKQGNPFLLIDNIEQFAKFRLELHAKYRKTPFTAISATELNNLFKKTEIN